LLPICGTALTSASTGGAISLNEDAPEPADQEENHNGQYQYHNSCLHAVSH
jgi:hypothetical protein